MIRATTAATALVLAASPAAQREEATLTWQRLQSEIEYGAVPLGEHGLEQLPPGRTWRLGSGPATTWTTQMPIVQGDVILAPGAYVLEVRRAGEQSFELIASGGARASLPGEFDGEHKPNKRLEISWDRPSKKKKGKTKGQLQETAVAIHFGPNFLHVPVSVPGNKRLKVRGYKAHAFTFPADLVEKRVSATKDTPIANLAPAGKPAEGEPASYNLVLRGDEVVLSASAQAPQRGRGRGEGRGGRGRRGGAATGAAGGERSGSIQWNEVQGERATLEISKLRVAKDQAITIEIRFGKKVGVAEIPGKPKGKRGDR